MTNASKSGLQAGGSLLVLHLAGPGVRRITYLFWSSNDALQERGQSYRSVYMSESL